MTNIIYPKGIEVVVGPYIINDKDEVLLVKSPKWRDWTICGGHVEVGETLHDAVIRETKEELGVDIKVIKQINVGEKMVAPPEFKRHAHFIYIDFLAKLTSENFTFNEEISEIKWFKIKDAINHKNVQESIRNSLKNIHTR